MKMMFGFAGVALIAGGIHAIATSAATASEVSGVFIGDLFHAPKCRNNSALRGPTPRRWRFEGRTLDRGEANECGSWCHRPAGPARKHTARRAIEILSSPM